jgi:general stress protein 26
MHSDQDKLYELLSEFSNAMFLTHTRSGDLHARPMRIAELTKEGELCFVTSNQSPKVKEIAQDSDVALIFQASSKFVSLSGTAVVEQDPKRLDRLWNEAWKVWFPKGKSDPNIRIVRILPREAEYWDNEGMEGLSYAFAAVKAYIQGEQPHVDSDQHGKVKL